MKKLALIIFLIANINYAQTIDCSKCKVQKLDKAKVKELSTFELRILRNEIYARNHHHFKDDLLTSHFSKYKWYKADSKNKEIKLNSIESYNTQLISKIENQKKDYQKLIIDELKILKKSLNDNNKELSMSFLENKEFKKSWPLELGVYPSILKTLKETLNSIDLLNVNWFSDRGFYKVTTDNGFNVNEKYLNVSGEEVVIYYGDQTHSEIIPNSLVFSTYESKYSSIEEHSSWFTFKIIENKLRIVSWRSAG